MPQIEFRENKVLKLINVLSRKVPKSEIMSQDKQVVMLMNWIKAKGYQTVGPLIMYSTGITGTDSDGQPIIDSRVMVQLNTSNVRLELPYRFEKEVRIPNEGVADTLKNYSDICHCRSGFSVHRGNSCGIRCVKYGKPVSPFPVGYG